MRRPLLTVAAVAAVVALLAVAALITLRLLINTPHVRSLIAAAATRALGRPVELAAVSLRVFPVPALELKGIEVAGDSAFGAISRSWLLVAKLRVPRSGCSCRMDGR